MKTENVSLISVFVNLLLGFLKLLFGFLSGSVALIADGIHSGLDVLSSFSSFLGLKISRKPKDEKHPYGHFRAESLSGFFIAFLLAVSGIWIIFESIMRFFGEEPVNLTYGAVIVVVASIVLSEFLARLKFHFGRKGKSLSLTADAEHSRADALSSVGVLLGLFLTRYFQLADAIIALLIGFYILYEAFHVGREITDSLLDVSNKEVEERIKRLCFNQKVEIADLKTRKIGAFNFAELKIKLPLKMKVEQVEKVLNDLKEKLLSNIQGLQQVVITIEGYDVSFDAILPKLGKRIGTLKGFEKIGPEKQGKRTIVPFKNDKISDKFGSEQYLVFDEKDDKVVFRKVIKNPYVGGKSFHGARFAKAIRADKVITKNIGENAKQNLENFGIEIQKSNGDY